MSEKELVLTSLKSFWPQNETHAVFLGHWCFAKNHKYRFWELDRADFISSPWDSIETIESAIEYIKSLYEKILDPLSDYLNTYYGTSFSKVFWKAATVEFSINWLNNVYDRYLRLREAEKYAEGGGLKVRINPSLKDCNIKDFSRFKLTVGSDYYNLWMFSLILSQLDFKNIILIQSDSVDAPEEFTDLPERNDRISRKQKVLRSFIPTDTYFSPRFTAKEKLYFRVKRPWKGVEGSWSEIQPVKEHDKKSILRFSAENPFEELISRIIMRSLPDRLFEGIPEVPVYKRCNYYFGNELGASQKSSFEIARVLENKGEWISVQHGGVYGQFRGTVEIEYYTSSKFITWGWNKYKEYTHLLPLPSLKLYKLPVHEEKNKKILFVSTSFSLYTTHLTFQSVRWFYDFLKDSKKFVKYLDASIREELILKSHKELKLWGISEEEFHGKDLLKEQFTETGLAVDYMTNCRVTIVPYLSTTFLEALHMNAPILMYSTEAEKPAFTKECMNYLDKMQKVGIYHKSPESAASFLNENYNSVQKWWHGKELQSIRREFCEKYALSSKNPLKDWGKFIAGLN